MTTNHPAARAQATSSSRTLSGCASPLNPPRRCQDDEGTITPDHTITSAGKFPKSGRSQGRGSNQKIARSNIEIHPHVDTTKERKIENVRMSAEMKVRVIYNPERLIIMKDFPIDAIETARYRASRSVLLPPLSCRYSSCPTSSCRPPRPPSPSTYTRQIPFPLHLITRHQPLQLVQTLSWCPSSHLCIPRHGRSYPDRRIVRSR
jgi:hypothetical protein